MKVSVIGSSGRGKIMFMYYLGKIISKYRETVVISDKSYFFDRLETIDFEDGFTISKEDVKREIIISEVDEEQDIKFLVIDLLANFPINGKDDFNVESAENIVFLNVLPYTAINEKYLINKFGITDETVYFIPLDERNIAVNIENSYNQKISLKGISGTYKKSLIQVVSQILGIDRKESAKLYKLAIK